MCSCHPAVAISRDAPCVHPVSDGKPSRVEGQVEHWTCGICRARLATDRATGKTTTEVTGR